VLVSDTETCDYILSVLFFQIIISVYVLVFVFVLVLHRYLLCKCNLIFQLFNYMIKLLISVREENETHGKYSIVQDK